jgi:hypothetical protein
MGSKSEDTARAFQTQYRRDFNKYGGGEAVDSYKKTLTGETPSFAQAMLQQETDRNIANQQALAASTRGRDPSVAARQAMNNTAALNQQAVGQSTMLRAQEIEQARSGLTGAATGFAGGRNQAAQVGSAVGQADDPWNKMTQLVKAGGDAASAAMMSDETKKTDIKDGGPKIEQFLDSIKAYAYKFKEGVKAPKGEHVTPMAQDLEKSSIGKDMVEDTPEGKMVDYARGFGAMLAAQAELHDRLKKLEKKKKVG